MYQKSGNFLQFFQPIITLAQNAAEVLKEIDIGASSADHGEYICVKPCMFHRGQFTLTSEVAGGTSVAPRVVLTKRITPLSASGEAVICTVIVPDATAVGKTVYKDIEPVQFNVGDSLEISHVIGTGTPTGQGVFSAMCHESPKQPAGNSDMIASA
jgi:hypothetical protein